MEIRERRLPFNPYVTEDDIMAVLVSIGRLMNLRSIKLTTDFVVDRRRAAPFYQYQWLLVQDSWGDWCEAVVRGFDQSSVRIHYVGWQDRYDERWSLSDYDRTRVEPYSADKLPLKSYSPFFWPDFYDYLMDLEGNAILDVLDGTCAWRAAYVRATREFPDGPMVLVHYIGWSAKYDEWLPIESYRLAPARTHVTRWPVGQAVPVR